MLHGGLIVKWTSLQGSLLARAMIMINPYCLHHELTLNKVKVKVKHLQRSTTFASFEAVQTRRKIKIYSPSSTMRNFAKVLIFQSVSNICEIENYLINGNILKHHNNLTFLVECKPIEYKAMQYIVREQFRLVKITILIFVQGRCSDQCAAYNVWLIVDN